VTHGIFGGRRCPHAVAYFTDVANMLVIVSSSTNFIIYFFLRPHFRAALRDRIACVENRDYVSSRTPSIGAPPPWHVDHGQTTGRMSVGRNSVEVNAVLDRNNHVVVSRPASPAVVVAIATPLMSERPRTRTTTM